jgi:hypothetical protein
MDDFATYYLLSRHYLHRETSWSTLWHGEDVTSTRPFPREMRKGDIDPEAKQLVCVIWSLRDSSPGVV